MLASVRMGIIADIHGNDLALPQHAEREHRPLRADRRATCSPCHPADAAGRIDLVERYAAMAAGIGWTRGVLDQAGLLGILDGLPAQLRLRLPGGATDRMIGGIRALNPGCRTAGEIGTGCGSY
jgi:hypothetical protein